MEHLEIARLDIHRKTTLCLPNLRVLCIYSLNDSSPDHLRLELPKLSKLFVYSLYDCIPVLYPTTVTHLGVKQLGKFVQKYQEFQECQYFYLRGSYFEDDHHLFTCFPRLEEIHCECIKKKEILYLIKQRNASRRFDVRIYFNGFSANEPDEVEELFDNGDRFVLTTQRFISGYHRLPRAFQEDVHLDYNELVRHFGNRLLSDFHTKLDSPVRELSIIGNVDDQDSLFRFIQKFSPSRMEIKFASLKQTSFYEDLHLHLPNLYTLYRLRIEEHPGVITNLDFIIKCSNLRQFSINHQIPYELIERMFKLNRSMEFEFLLNGQPITIKNEGYFSEDKLSVQISDQKHTYTKDTFLNGVRQAFGLPSY